MYKVKGIAAGQTRTVIHACGTAEQAFDKVLQLIGQGLQEVRVTDPAGKEWTASDFQRNFGD